MSNTLVHFGPHDIRVIKDGTGTFEVVAKDVVEGIGATWNGNAAIAHVPDEWKGVRSVLTPGGMQEMAVLKEPGLYFYLGRSDKPAALPMQKWVSGEVLPSIRKTGSYTAKNAVGPLKATAEAAKAFPALARVARMLGCDKNAAAIAANQAIFGLTNINLMKQLGTTHLEAEKQDTLWFTPTELGQRFHNTSARGMNLLLAEAGLQAKINDKWEPTQVGREFCRLFDTSKKQGSGVPVMQVKWSINVLPMLGESKEAA
jgi:prophage antirepressor-like protein